MVAAFFAAQLAACNDHQVKVGNVSAGESYFDGSTHDPSRSITVLKDLGSQRDLTRDAGGNRLIVDLTKKQITGPAGPNDVLPRPYTFCSHETWVVTLDEGHVEPPPAPARFLLRRPPRHLHVRHRGPWVPTACPW